MGFIKDRFKNTESSRDIVGLDIGYSAIRSVVLESSGPALTLKHYCVEPLSLGLTQHWPTHAKEQITAGIKRSLATIDTYSKHCVIAVPDSVITSRWLRFDSATAEDIETALHAAVEEYIPCPLDDIYFDYQVFDTYSTDQNYLDVLLVACRKEQVDARLEIVHYAGLTPLSVEINSHVIRWTYARLYSANLMQTCILVDIGATHLTLSFGSETQQMYSCHENMIALVSKETILQRVQQFFSLFYLSYPYHQFNKLIFIGSDRLLLEFLIEKLTDLYGLKIEILILEQHLLLFCSHVNQEEFISLFPTLFLSFSLAFRGLKASLL